MGTPSLLGCWSRGHQNPAGKKKYVQKQKPIVISISVILYEKFLRTVKEHNNVFMSSSMNRSSTGVSDKTFADITSFLFDKARGVFLFILGLLRGLTLNDL